MSNKVNIHEILKTYWGFDTFRTPQDKIIESSLANLDVLALLPTGGGKSICFQVPAMAKPGLCIVVSPLIALMKDQVENLKAKGIKAYAIYSGMSGQEIKVIFENCQFGAAKFLYLSPERLTTELFKDNLHQLPVSLLAIDEAHCISQWGHEFRPEYRKLKEIRSLLPNVPVLALTASATPKVIEDIMVQLDFKMPLVYQKSFERKNLHYIVRHTEDKYGKLLESISKIKQSGLVYVRNRKMTEEIANYLVSNGIIASFYHAGLAAQIREKRQEDWIRNKVQIMVCTNAFGMGIDKPDCALVVHFEIPDCLEAYYQEAGRAGRNGKNAYCLLLYHESDALQAKAKLLQQYPDSTYLKFIFDKLNHFYNIPIGKYIETDFPFDLIGFSKYTNQNPIKVQNALKLLSQSEIIHISEGVFTSDKIRILLRHSDLFDLKTVNELWHRILEVVVRMHGGVFENLTSIAFNDLAMKANVSEQKLLEELIKLMENGIIDFQPKDELSKITFLHPRIVKDHLPINYKLIQNRKVEQEEKLEAIINYGHTKDICRSRLILTYFGEKDIIDCGACDVCMRKNTDPLSAQKFVKIEKELVNLNWDKPISIKDLVKLLKAVNTEDLLIVCRYLADKGDLTINEKQEIHWTKENK